MAATSQMSGRNLFLGRLLLLFYIAVIAQTTYSAILPEDRADVMYHRYDGGGMVIDGPSMLIRKSIGDNISVAGNYYIDKVSSASIDVQTQGASEYAEERTEYSVDTTYLIDSTTVNLGFTKSTENDYDASSARIDISHAFFGEMTTIALGFSQGDDDITSSRDETFADSLKRRNYRFGVSQILSKNFLLNINYEGIIDEGYLQNPYRKIIETRCFVPAIDLESCPTVSRTAELGDEIYPRTRNSDAFSAKLSWYLPWRAALKFRVGYFSDSWDIESTNFSIDYSQRLNEEFIADFRIRSYQQSEANFYANHFFSIDGITLPEFRARDKELSEHSSYSVGFGISYRRDLEFLVESLEVNGQIDYFVFDYDNFLEYSEALNPTTDVLGADSYNFDAYALRVFFTLRY